jgi:hypothetical protein
MRHARLLHLAIRIDLRLGDPDQIRRREGGENGKNGLAALGMRGHGRFARENALPSDGLARDWHGHDPEPFLCFRSQRHRGEGRLFHRASDFGSLFLSSSQRSNDKQQPRHSKAEERPGNAGVKGYAVHRLVEY